MERETSIRSEGKSNSSLAQQLQRAYREKHLLLSEVQQLRDQLKQKQSQSPAPSRRSSQYDKATWDRLLNANVRAGTMACMWCIRCQIVKIQAKAFHLWKDRILLSGGSPQKSFSNSRAHSTAMQSVLPLPILADDERYIDIEVRRHDILSSARYLLGHSLPTSVMASGTRSAVHTPATTRSHPLHRNNRPFTDPKSRSKPRARSLSPSQALLAPTTASLHNRKARSSTPATTSTTRRSRSVSPRPAVSTNTPAAARRSRPQNTVVMNGHSGNHISSKNRKNSQHVRQHQRVFDSREELPTQSSIEHDTQLRHTLSRLAKLQTQKHRSAASRDYLRSYLSIEETGNAEENEEVTSEITIDFEENSKRNINNGSNLGARLPHGHGKLYRAQKKLIYGDLDEPSPSLWLNTLGK